MRYAITTNAFSTSNVADTYLAALVAKAVTGAYGRLVALAAHHVKEAAVDENMMVRVVRSDNTADGTGTAITPAKLPGVGPASAMTCKQNLTVNPTTNEATFLIETGFNLRGQLYLPVYDLQIEWYAGTTLQFQIAPETAAARVLAATMIWEE